MHPPIRRATAFALFALAALVTGFDARADQWLTFRHDPQRTGASSGALSVDQPTVIWSRYLGGQLTPSQYLVADVDADGDNEVVYVAGGRVIAKRPDNVTIWESPLLDLALVRGVIDLDHDGTLDVIVQSGFHAYVLSGRDGSVEWTSPTGAIQSVCTTRLGDFDADHKLDLYIGECRCGTLRGTSDGVAFSFASGFASAGMLWAIPAGTGGCGAEGDQVADIDGDGHADVLIPAVDAAMKIVNGVDGTVRWQIAAPASGGFYPGTTAYLVNLDAEPGLEIVAVSNGYEAANGIGARRIGVWKRNADVWSLLWEADAPDRTMDSLTTAPGGIADFNGDGMLDVAFTITASGTPHVEVRTAISGTVLAMQPMATFVGAVDLDADMRPEVLTAQGSTLTVNKVSATGLSTTVSVPQRSALDFIDHTQWLTDSNASALVALNLDSDPALELVIKGNDSAGNVALWAYKLSGTSPVEIGHFSAVADVTVLTTAITLPLTNAYPQIATVTSDGYLIVLDHAMQPTNRIVDPEITIPGMRVGGYYSGPGGLGPTPQIAHFDTDAIVVRDSRPDLMRLDASAATLESSPTVVWERAGAAWPAIVDADADGTQDLVVVQGQDAIAIDALTGHTVIWRATGAIGSLGTLGDLLPAHHGTETDVYFPRQLPGEVMQAVAIEAATGTIRWQPFTRALQWGYQSYSVGDLNGDGNDEFVSVTNSVHSLNGVDGTLLNDNGTFVAYAMPMLMNAQADGATDVWVHGGYYPDRLLSATMTDIVVRSDETSHHTDAWGALVTCAGVPAVVQGTFQSADIWTVRPRDAMGIAHRVLAGGQSYAPGAVPMSVRPGVLGNATAVASLVPGGTPAVLVGSTDGYLYALDPCTLALVWSLNLRYPVGESVVGDVNGDGVDDLLVTVADGFLYAIGHPGYPAPMQVLDTDPPGGHPHDDVDMIDTVDTLYAEWTPVANAASYEVGVFTAAGTEVRFPNYHNVGNVTSVSIPQLPLRQGQRYVISVRAFGPGGAGLEAHSNGVTVTDVLPPTAQIAVAPSPAWPAGHVRPVVNGMCADRVALAHATVDVRRDDGTVVVVLQDVDAIGQQHAFQFTWDGNDTTGAASPAGNYHAHVHCVDAHLQTADGDAPFVLDPSAAVVDAGMTGHDAGAMDSGTGGMHSGGCGCAVPGRTGRSCGAMLVAVLAVGVGVRRRRRARVSITG